MGNKILLQDDGLYLKRDDTMQPNEDFVDGIFRVYNNPICEVIDNYNCGAFYEPSYVIARAYLAGEF